MAGQLRLVSESSNRSKNHPTPSGAVTAYIRYRFSARRRRASEYGAFRVPGETEVMLSVGNVRLSYHGMDISTVETGSGWSRAIVGTVEVAEAGEYRITARPELEHAVEPQILVGS